MTRRGRASAALAVGGALWGLYWIPLRWLASAGVEGLWPGVIMVAGAGILSTAYALSRRLLTPAVLIAGFVTGAAFGLYSAALLLTDVARAILLFYLTPIWGTILGRLLLAEAISGARLAALLFALAGLGVIFGIGTDAFLLANTGDLLALASGIIWAVGSLLIFRMPGASLVGQSSSFLIGTVIVSMLFIPLTGEAVTPTLPSFALTIPAAFFVLPMILLTVWPASVLTPARVGLILMTEVVVGLTSAALFAGEPFGAREAIGALLIVTAAFIEVLGHKDTDSNTGRA